MSDGSCFKAPDEPEVSSAVDRLAARGIPVVTLVTDVRDCARVAYLGPTTRAPGDGGLPRERVGGERPGCVLVTLSRTAFFGERERLEGFRPLWRRGTLEP